MLPPAAPGRMRAIEGGELGRARCWGVPSRRSYPPPAPSDSRLIAQFSWQTATIVGVQLQLPFRTITPTLDGDVLRVLGRADAWFSAARIRSLADSGSTEGIRRVLRRLEDQGVVETQAAGKAFLYRLNREHLAAPAIVELAELDRTFRDRVRRSLEGFHDAPLYAFLFGSAARGAMRADSDIDLMLIRDRPATPRWEDDLEALRRDVHRWTGNDPRVIEYHRDEIMGASAEEPVLRSVAAEGIALAGSASRFRKDIAAR